VGKVFILPTQDDANGGQVKLAHPELQNQVHRSSRLLASFLSAFHNGVMAFQDK
jgi:hypothetical protein